MKILLVLAVLLSSSYAQATLYCSAHTEQSGQLAIAVWNKKKTFEYIHVGSPAEQKAALRACTRSLEKAKCSQETTEASSFTEFDGLVVQTIETSKGGETVYRNSVTERGFSTYYGCAMSRAELAIEAAESAADRVVARLATQSYSSHTDRFIDAGPKY